MTVTARSVRSSTHSPVFRIVLFSPPQHSLTSPFSWGGSYYVALSVIEFCHRLASAPGITSVDCHIWLMTVFWLLLWHVFVPLGLESSLLFPWKVKQTGELGHWEWPSNNDWLFEGDHVSTSPVPQHSVCFAQGLSFLTVITHLMLYL